MRNTRVKILFLKMFNNVLLGGQQHTYVYHQRLNTTRFTTGVYKYPQLTILK